MKCACFCFLLVIFLTALSTLYVTQIALQTKGIFIHEKIQSDCLQAIFYLSGATSNSPLPFNRFLPQLIPQTQTDEKTIYSLSVPSLQPETEREISLRLYVPEKPKVSFLFGVRYVILYLLYYKQYL